MFKYVQVSGSVNQIESPIKIRIYHEVKVSTGPDVALVDNYNDYVILYGDDKLAYFLLNKGYELLCHRVAYTLGPANCTKFIKTYNSEKYEYFYQDTGRYLNKNLIADTDGATYTYHLYIDPESTDFDYIYVIRTRRDTTAGISDVYNSSKIGLFSLSYMYKGGLTGEISVRKRFQINPTNGYSVFKEHSYKSSEEIEEDVLNFLSNNCTLTVEDMGAHHYLVSSDTPGLQILIGGTKISKISTSDDYYNRTRVSGLQSNKIISISSKYDSSLSDISVTISHANFDEYIFEVKKDCGDFIYTESYECPIYKIDEIINQQSKVIKIDLYNITYETEDEEGNTILEYYDISGTYNLEGTFGYYDILDHLNRLESLDIDEEDIPQIDVYFDEYENTKFGELIREKFPKALMFSRNNPDISGNMSIYPSRIYWYNYDIITNSGIYILDNIKDFSLESSKDDILLLSDTSETEYLNEIVETPYSYEFENFYGSLNKKRYSPRYLLTRAMIYRVLGEIIGNSQEDIESNLNSRMEMISDLTGSIADYEITSTSLKGRRLTINMNIRIDNRILTKYSLYIEVIYE